MAQHTPGPWKATTDKASDGWPGFRIMAGGLEVARSYLNQHASTADFNGDGIKEYPEAVHFYGGGTAWTTPENAARARADARLIAAAPDLLAALEDLVRRCDGAEGVRPDGSNIDTLHATAVLMKAKGEPWDQDEPMDFCDLCDTPTECGRCRMKGEVTA